MVRESSLMESDIAEVSSFEELSKCLEKKMKPFYPNGDLDGWRKWGEKYFDLETAKRAANHMYIYCLRGV